MQQLKLLCLRLLAMALAVVDQEIPVYTGCGGNITDVPHGIIDSPGNGSNYPKNVNCIWHISLDEWDRMEVSFQRFRTKYKHILLVKNGEMGTTIGTFRQDTLPGTFETAANKLFLYFNPKRVHKKESRRLMKGHKKGFRLSWKKIRECPVEKGFFYQYSSTQCFKYFPDGQRYNWTQASDFCESEGLVLPRPFDGIGLRSYMVQRYSQYNVPWINARKVGDEWRWQDDNSTLSSDNSFWHSGHPRSDYDCVLLLVMDHGMTEEPEKPFYTRPCNQSDYRALCELPGPVAAP